MDETTIVIKALSLESGLERHDFLSQACSTDAFREQIEEALTKIEVLESLATPTESERDVDISELTFFNQSLHADSIGRVDHYEILRVLRANQQTLMMLGFDSTLDRVVLIKSLTRESQSDNEVRNEFLATRSTLATLSSSYLAQVVGGGEQNDVPYVVIEAVRGTTLNNYLAVAGQLDADQAFRIANQITMALCDLHGSGMLLGPVNVSEIFVDELGKTAKISGLPFPRLATGTQFVHEWLTSQSQLGEPPEIRNGGSPDVRSDLYRLGQIFQELRSKLADKASTDSAKKTASLENIHQPQDFAEWFGDVTNVLLEQDPEDRFQSATDLLQVFAAHEPKQVVETASFRTLMRPTQPKTYLKRAFVAFLVFTLGFGVYSVFGMVFLQRFNPLGPWMPYFRNAGLLAVDTGNPEMVFTVQLPRRTVSRQGSFQAHLPAGHYNLTGFLDNRPVYCTQVLLEGNVRTRVVVEESDRFMPWSNHEEIPLESDPDLFAAMWILEQGGKVQFRETASSNSLDASNITDLPTNGGFLLSAKIEHFPEEDLLELVQSLSMCSRLQSIHIANSRVTGSIISALGEIRTLRQLELANVVETSFEQVSELKSLVLLNQFSLNYSPNSLDFVKVMSELPNLESLSIVDCPLHDEDLAAISGCEELTTLTLSSRFLTPACVDHFAVLPNLKSLQLESPQLTDQLWKKVAVNQKFQSIGVSGIKNEAVNSFEGQSIGSLRELKSLTSLRIRGVNFDESSFRELVGLKQVRSLTLDECRLENIKLEEFAEMTNLSELIIDDSVVESEAVTSLKPKMPHCMISYNNNSKVTL
ncbi:protein kinase [Thalassoglobus sp. JC818]|uniref:protein kinase domain-containing protein n=1 Tax=Thalassoglobus sp. JC818 TaxID=3232136 RepID=UPI00345968B6